MCNIYQSTPKDDLVDWFKVAAPSKPYAATIAPLKDGPFIKADDICEVGQWGMIPAPRRPAHPLPVTVGA